MTASCTDPDLGRLAADVVEALVAARSTVASAESLTGGLVAVTLTEVPGASRAFRGAVVAYATELKHELLGVPSEHLRVHGAVDPGTARLMAQGVRERLGTTYGVATTGVAGPDLQEGQSAGTVHVAVAGPLSVQVRSLLLPGSRQDVRRASVQYALELLLATLAGR